MKKEGKVGRPPKLSGRREKRSRITLVIPADTKRRIAVNADRNGVSLSAEVEAMIARLETIESVLAGMGSSEENLARQGFEAAARKLGYRPHRGVHGIEWLPPGHPGGSHHEWLDPDKTEDQQ